MKSIITLLALTAYMFPLCCIIISIYGTRKLLDHKDAMFMKKRETWIVFGLNISVIVAIVSVITLDAIILYHNHIITLILGAIFFTFSWWNVLFFLNVKNWLIYYKYFWTYYTLQLQWQQIINPNTQSIQNWFLKKNYKYGKVRYISKLFGVIHIFGYIICITTLIMCADSIIYTFICGFTFISPVLFNTIIVCKTPSFQDAIYLHWECKMHRNILILSPLSLIFSAIAYFITYSITFTSFVSVSSLTAILFAICYVSTIGIINKNTIKSHNKKKINPLHIVKQRKLSLKGFSSGVSDSDIKLEDIFKNKRALNLFMSHLAKEYNMECILSYIEFTQFHEYLLKSMPQYEVINLTNRRGQLPTNVPESEIIIAETPSILKQKTEKLNDSILISAKRRAYKLYQKYIEPNGEYEINISGVMRNNLSNVLGVQEQLMNSSLITLVDLYKLFQEPIDEMLHLLGFSFDRFRQSEKFKEFISTCTPSRSRSATLLHNVLNVKKESNRQKSSSCDMEYTSVIKAPNINKTPTTTKSDDYSTSDMEESVHVSVGQCSDTTQTENDMEGAMVYIDY